MKKNYFYSMMAASMLFAASCSQEEIVDVTKGEGQKMTFKVEIPGTQSRAIADGIEVGAGKYADKLIYAMYEEDQDVVLITDFAYDNDKDGDFEVTLPMAKDIKYDILFLAYNADNNAFVLDNSDARANNLKALRMKSELKANQETYDAFIGSLDSKGVDATATTTVKLYRPFAQVNAATTLEDLNTVKTLKAEVSSSKFKIYNAPNTLNVFTGGVSGKETFTYQQENILKKHGQTEYPYNEILPIEGTNGYYYLAMSYVLAGREQSSTYDADFLFYRADDKLVSSLNVLAMPIQANYRTNILGTLLTKQEDYVIQIDAQFGEPANEEMIVVQKSEVKDETELLEVIEAIEEDNQNSPEKTLYVIEIGEDITLGGTSTYSRAAAADCINIPAGKSVKIDLKGHNITGIDNATGSFGLINLAPGSNLSIINSSTTEGGNITLTAKNNREWNAYSSVISNQRATLTVGANVVVEHLGGTDMAYGIDNLTNTGAEHAKTTIEGATIKSTYRAIRQFLNSSAEGVNNELYVNSGTIEGENKSIWMQDANEYANPGKLVVTENASLKGDVYLFVAAGSTEWPVEVSIAASALDGESTVLSANVPYDYTVVENDGVWTVQLKDPVAKIGEKGFTTLQKAVIAVEDGGTITLVANETFTEQNRFDNGGWWDGIGYSGDKSFTIDLNGKTISQNGALNDYLMWFKNDGLKGNTITLKNGTLDAGTTAYCALATSSSNAQKITINTENITFVNNNSNGAVLKIRGGSELNVKAGTIIEGMNSYVGIEAVGNNTVVNIYDDAKIYQKGTSSYVGAIVGASYNATMNIYGGYGKSAKCGIIVMSTGATINVSGGEWIANNDGTVASDNNAVLVSQNNRNESGWACKSVLNVTGGTFKGGYNCYGMGPGVEADDAQINIKGGNFNADPSSYLVEGYKINKEGTTYEVVVAPAAKIGETEYNSLQDAFNVGGNITLLRNVTIAEPATLSGGKTAILDLNGKTLTANLVSALVATEGANLTVKNGNVIAYESTVRAIGGKATIESGEYTSTGTALDTPATYRYSLDCREEGGELVINGGTFKSNNGMINVGSTVTINGGKFENIVEKTMTRHFAYVSAPLTINDGEFYGKANGGAGGCFFCGAAAGGEITVNGGKFTSLWTSGSVNRIFEVYYGGTINVTGGMFNTNGGIATFVTENTDEATKAAYPYVAK